MVWHPDRLFQTLKLARPTLALLDARWSRKIDYSPFGGTKPEKVWSTIYEYRSAIAHGGNADFSATLNC